MKRFSVVGSLTAMLALAGCQMMDNDFGGSTPTAENVALSIPASGSSQSALTASDGTKVSAGTNGAGFAGLEDATGSGVDPSDMPSFWSYA